jgi:hypothetical protein
MFMHETRRGCDDIGARPIRRADPERAAQVAACREEFWGDSRLTRLLGTCH